MAIAATIACGTGAGGSGDVSGGANLSAVPNRCPTIDGFAVAPVAAPVGGVMMLSATATDPNGDSLSYKWSSTSGWVAEATARDARFVCTASGAVTLTVGASDGLCTETATLDVTCL